MLSYKPVILNIENISIPDIASNIGTPFYCYSYHQIAENYQIMRSRLNEKHLICFAVKANPNIAILNSLAKLGCGADCVSLGEIKRALKAGIPANKIVFSGVGKTQEEIKYALEQGILQFNVESIAELLLINKISKSLSLIANIALRVNPDVNSNTHEKITTGSKDNKFGISKEQIVTACDFSSKLDNISLQGLSVHIGSQILDIEPFKQAFEVVKSLVVELGQLGHHISTIDLGGGIGIQYKEDDQKLSIAEYIDIAQTVARDLNCRLILEPGRFIVANSGILVSRLSYIKVSNHKIFYILNCGMNDLMRPALYHSYHQIIPIFKPADNGTIFHNVDIVGPVCESSDIFLQNISFPKLNEGELIAIKDVGAYGASMSSSYNSRDLIPEVMVKDNQFVIIRKRQTIEDMMALETMPDWLD